MDAEDFGEMTPPPPPPVDEFDEKSAAAIKAINSGDLTPQEAVSNLINNRDNSVHTVLERYPELDQEVAQGAQKNANSVADSVTKSGAQFDTDPVTGLTPNLGAGNHAQQKLNTGSSFDASAGSSSVDVVGQPEAKAVAPNGDRANSTVPTNLDKALASINLDPSLGRQEKIIFLGDAGIKARVMDQAQRLGLVKIDPASRSPILNVSTEKLQEMFNRAAQLKQQENPGEKIHTGLAVELKVPYEKANLLQSLSGKTDHVFRVFVSGDQAEVTKQLGELKTILEKGAASGMFDRKSVEDLVREKLDPEKFMDRTNQVLDKGDRSSITLKHSSETGNDLVSSAKDKVATHNDLRESLREAKETEKLGLKSETAASSSKHEAKTDYAVNAVSELKSALETQDGLTKEITKTNSKGNDYSSKPNVASVVDRLQGIDNKSDKEFAGLSDAVRKPALADMLVLAAKMESGEFKGAAYGKGVDNVTHRYASLSDAKGNPLKNKEGELQGDPLSKKLSRWLDNEISGDKDFAQAVDKRLTELVEKGTLDEKTKSAILAVVKEKVAQAHSENTSAVKEGATAAPKDATSATTSKETAVGTEAALKKDEPAPPANDKLATAAVPERATTDEQNKAFSGPQAVEGKEAAESAEKKETTTAAENSAAKAQVGASKVQAPSEAKVSLMDAEKDVRVSPEERKPDTVVAPKVEPKPQAPAVTQADVAKVASLEKVGEQRAAAAAAEKSTSASLNSLAKGMANPQKTLLTDKVTWNMAELNKTAKHVSNLDAGALEKKSPSEQGMAAAYSKWLADGLREGRIPSLAGEKGAELQKAVIAKADELSKFSGQPLSDSAVKNISKADAMLRGMDTHRERTGQPDASVTFRDAKTDSSSLIAKMSPDTQMVMDLLKNKSSSELTEGTSKLVLANAEKLTPELLSKMPNSERNALIGNLREVIESVRSGESPLGAVEDLNPKLAKALDTADRHTTGLEAEVRNAMLGKPSSFSNGAGEKGADLDMQKHAGSMQKAERGR